jgi:hypothetical protein
LFRRFSAAWLLLAAGLGLSLLSGCGDSVSYENGETGGGDSVVNFHRTRHFLFVYDTTFYTRAEIEANGRTKEAHLARIEKELGVSFDKEILVRLISESGASWSGQAYPQEPYFIQETRGYFIQDNGHEIVHIVSFETLGFPGARFFVEGLAAAHELDPKPKWARLCGFQMDSSRMMETLKDMATVGVSERVDYALAAAYVEWMEQEFGLARFRAFYGDLATFYGSSLSSISLRDLGVEEDELHGRFIHARYLSSTRSKYCDERIVFSPG